MTEAPWRVIVFDDQTLVRQGIRGLLALSDAIDVVAEGSDGDQAVDLVARHEPDVVLMDIRMPKCSGIDAVGALQAAGHTTPVIMLTTFDDHEQVLDSIRAGARGYLLKDVTLEHLVAAIDSVARGGTMIQPALTTRLINALGDAQTPASPAPLEALSPKELDVLRLMAGGYSNKEISSALGNSEGTIKNHVSSILAKLAVRDRTRAVLKAFEHGLL
ncbi:MAG: response regulator transcription factor [Pseudomonadota bacterium]